MIKKAVIAAAGRGTRMLDLSKDRPKHLIEVGGKPFLYYLLTNLKQAGLTDLIMVIGYKKEAMTQFSRRYSGEFKITVINQFERLGDKYGSACPIECVEDLIQEDFISVNGDNLYSPGDLKQMKIEDQFTYVAGLEHSNPQKYGVLKRGEDDFLERIIEKPSEPVGNLINIGLYKFTPEIFGAVKQIHLSPRGEYELTDAISLLAREKKVKIKMAQDYWLDFGKPADIETIEKFLSERKI